MPAAAAVLRRAGALSPARRAGGARKGGGELMVYIRAEGELHGVSVDAAATVGDLARAAAAAVPACGAFELEMGGRRLPPAAALADEGVGQEAVVDAAPCTASEWARCGPGLTIHPDDRRVLRATDTDISAIASAGAAAAPGRRRSWRYVPLLRGNFIIGLAPPDTPDTALELPADEWCDVADDFPTGYQRWGFVVGDNALCGRGTGFSCGALRQLPGSVRGGEEGGHSWHYSWSDGVPAPLTMTHDAARGKLTLSVDGDDTEWELFSDIPEGQPLVPFYTSWQLSPSVRLEDGVNNA